MFAMALLKAIAAPSFYGSVACSFRCIARLFVSMSLAALIVELRRILPPGWRLDGEGGGDVTGSPKPDASGTGGRAAKSPSNALTQGSQIGILRSGPAWKGACRSGAHFRKVLFTCFLRAGWLLLRPHCR
jgi:hypothetical protein